MFVNFGLEKVMVPDDELKVFENLENCFEPIVLGSEMICRREATLLTAEDTLTFMFKKTI